MGKEERFTIELPDIPTKKKKKCFGYVKEPYRSKNPVLRVLDLLDFGLPYRPWWVFVGVLVLPLVAYWFLCFLEDYTGSLYLFEDITGIDENDYIAIYLISWIPYWSVARVRRNFRFEMFLCLTYQNWGRVVRYWILGFPYLFMTLWIMDKIGFLTDIHPNIGKNECGVLFILGYLLAVLFMVISEDQQ